ncbi:extracellular solute-binding protein [Vagococcus sp. BWB3-3]|uniref:Extracellular solute-binding protein n=1 Tax=Vagococcus allomyrinae TaxID=2794353 RepID=A0A940SZ09_9ENTE|nr:extracellular solute-binding protein [Vagococcus allomyrinae]MBP1043948.1 extracellular solute-binding protein [Vagococcus allomyrinae]
MTKNWKRLLIVTLCATALLAACSGGKEKEAAAGGTYDENAAAEISWLNILHTASPPTDTITNKLQENTNTTIKFSWIPDASKEERINTSLASDSLADMVTLTMMENSSVRNALKSGMFWEVEDYLDDYPNLKEISAEMRASASIEGKLYGVPFQKDLARNGVVIRQDWLDKLGLDVPTTTDELMAVAKAFTLDDPDGNGKADTTGFVDRSDLIYGAFKTLGSYMGVPNKWAVDKSGKMTPEFDTEAYVETMDYMKELYDNSFINKDFAVTAKTDQQQNFAQGKAGIYVGALFDSKNLLNMAKDIQDGMELVLVNNITSTGKEEDRAIWAGNNGIGGLLSFPKSEVKDEAELKRILKFVDDLMTEESYALMTYGVEDVHYTVDDDRAATITDTPLWQQEVQPFASSRPNETGFEIHDADPLKQEADRLIAENAEFAVMNPAYALESETNTAQGSELEKIVTDATYKYILGEIKLADFEKAIENWKSSGGQTIITEYEAAYKELNK